MKPNSVPLEERELRPAGGADASEPTPTPPAVPTPRPEPVTPPVTDPVVAMPERAEVIEPSAPDILTRPGETPLDAAVRRAALTKAAQQVPASPAGPQDVAELIEVEFGDQEKPLEPEPLVVAVPADTVPVVEVIPDPEPEPEPEPVVAAAVAEPEHLVEPEPEPAREHVPTEADEEYEVETTETTGPPARSVPVTDLASPAALEKGDSTEKLGVSPGRVVCIVNQKGGVGKTTTTVSLAGSLAQQGARVLVIDLDPQGNATTGLGLRAHRGGDSIYRVLTDDLPLEDATEPTSLRGLYVVPSTLDLAGAEIELVSMFSREQRLRDAIGVVRDLYDIVLIDCPPSLGLLTINALTAADDVIVPIQCEYYALEGLGQLLTTVELVQQRLNPNLAIAGVVLTMFDGHATLSHQVVDEVRRHFGDGAFKTMIPRTVRLSEAPSFGLPITLFDPNSRGARSYTRLAREVAERLDLTLTTSEDPLGRLLASRAQTPRDLVASPADAVDAATQESAS